MKFNKLSSIEQVTYLTKYPDYISFHECSEEISTLVLSVAFMYNFDVKDSKHCKYLSIESWRKGWIIDNCRFKKH